MGKSKKQKKEKVDTQAWVRNMVAEFFHPIVVESSIPDAVEAAPAPLPVEEESANYCEKVACKRKSTNGCIHKFCAVCCIAVESEEECQVHSNAKRRQFDNDRVFEEMMQEMGGARDFTHAEEKLTKVCQTVLIWCVKDFLRYKRFNEDVFERYEREKRKKLMDLRRHGGHLLYPSPTVSPVKAHAGSRDGVAKKAIAHTSSSSSSSTANILSPNKSSRGGSNTNKSKSNSNSSSNSSSNSRTSDMTAREKRYSKWLASRVKPAQPKSEAAKFADLLKKG